MSKRFRLMGPTIVACIVASLTGSALISPARGPAPPHRLPGGRTVAPIPDRRPPGRVIMEGVDTPVMPPRDRMQRRSPSRPLR